MPDLLSGFKWISYNRILQNRITKLECIWKNYKTLWDVMKSNMASKVAAKFDFPGVMMAIDFFLVECGQHYGWKWVPPLKLRSKRHLVGELSVKGAILQGTWAEKWNCEKYIILLQLHICAKPKIIIIKKKKQTKKHLRYIYFFFFFVQ